MLFSHPSSGQVAQLVEQWTENPCVGGSIPSLTTMPHQVLLDGVFFFAPNPLEEWVEISLSLRTARDAGPDKDRYAQII